MIMSTTKHADAMWSLSILFVLTLPSFVLAEGDVSLQKIGDVQILRPNDIENSPFSLGCETLDRELWKPNEVYPFLSDLGIKWARLQTGWVRCERRKGEYDWEWLDEAVDGLIEIGIQPWLNVGYGNPLYTKNATGAHPMSSDEAFDAWKQFVVAMTKHFEDRIQYYEIWNEPNLEFFWRPGPPDPEKYARLVAGTTPLIRENDPNAVVIGGVTAGIPFNYIKGALDAGLADNIDVFSFHPYTTYPEAYIQRIVALRKLLDGYKPGMKLWQGENGYPSESNSTGFVGEGPWTENIQAKTMLRRLLIDCSLGIDLTNWFIVIDLHDYPKGSGRVNYKGILKAKPDIGPKVCFKSLQYLTSLVNGKVSSRNGVLHFSRETLNEKTAQVFYSNNKGNACGVFGAALQCDKGPIIAYWLTEKPQDSRAFDSISLAFEDWQGNGINDPVLVDLLNGTVYQLDNTRTFSSTRENKIYNDLPINRTSSSTRKDTIFNDLPISDYPLLIMGKAAVLRNEAHAGDATQHHQRRSIGAE